MWTSSLKRPSRGWLLSVCLLVFAKSHDLSLDSYKLDLWNVGLKYKKWALGLQLKVARLLLQAERNFLLTTAGVLQEASNQTALTQGKTKSSRSMYLLQVTTMAHQFVWSLPVDACESSEEVQAATKVSYLIHALTINNQIISGKCLCSPPFT